MNKKARYEFKYILGPYEAALVEYYVNKAQLSLDRHSSNGSYPITSLYFDTPTMGDYYDKLAGLNRRKKLRARIYADKFGDKGVDYVWMEVKEKINMNIFKHRSPILPEDWNRFSGAGDNFDGSVIYPTHKDKLGHFFFHFFKDNYRPHIVVRYKRKAYEGNFFSDFRLTLDSDLEACRWEDFKRGFEPDPVRKEKVIMEAKFTDGLPWWFKKMLAEINLCRDAFSKYTHSVDALNKLNPLPR